MFKMITKAVLVAGLGFPSFIGSSMADNHEYEQILEWNFYDYRDRGKYEWPKHWPAPNLKKYKTYPDIWGWNIPHLKIDLYDGLIHDIGVDERIVFYGAYKQDENNPTEKKWVYYFQELFRGKKWEITKDEKWELYKNNTFGRHQGSKYDRYTYEDGLPHGWEINDGGRWEVFLYPNIAHQINIPYMTLKKGTDAKVEKKLFVRILEHSKKMRSGYFSSPEINYQGRLIFYSFTVRESFVLRDLTFLGIIYSSQRDPELDQKYILRYTIDLKVPYLKNFDDMYTLDASEIELILKEADAKFKGDSVELQTFLDQKITAYLLNRGYKQ